MKQFVCVRCGEDFQQQASRRSLCVRCKAIIAKQGSYTKLKPVGLDTVKRRFSEAHAYNQVKNG